MSCRSYKEICLEIIDRFAEKVIISKCENYSTNFSTEYIQIGENNLPSIYFGKKEEKDFDDSCDKSFR